MRLLLCTHRPLLHVLGGSKVLLDFRDSVARLGHEACIVHPPDLGISIPNDATGRRSFAIRVGEYLSLHSHDFDVVEIDHELNPFTRTTVSDRSLVVARSVLMAQHLASLTIPQPRNVRALIGRALFGRSRAAEMRGRIDAADQTMHQADLINVSNTYDAALLSNRGFPAEKVVVLPFGIDAARREAFDAVPLDPPATPVIAFLGTFDYRKGASDLPRIFGAIAAEIPKAEFVLLGTAGSFQTEAEVLAFFPRRLRHLLRVVPRYEPGELPGLLTGCSIGVFPSYYEGFGIGVLEMLAAAVPVIAYDAPGAPMMIERDALVQPGDWQGMTSKVLEMLRAPELLRKARAAARATSHRFDWNQIARQTIDIYADRLSRLRAASR